MVSAVHASARVFRVRTEFVGRAREMRVHVLCECGTGAWIAAIASFPDLFFDERPLLGRRVGEALAWLGEHYAGLRVLADILDPPTRCCDPAPAPARQAKHSRKTAATGQARPKSKAPRRGTRPENRQGELSLALPRLAESGDKSQGRRI